jgi:hypothetical protein
MGTNANAGEHHTSKRHADYVRLTLRSDEIARSIGKATRALTAAYENNKPRNVRLLATEASAHAAELARTLAQLAEAFEGASQLT